MSDPFKDLQTVQIPLRNEHINGVSPEDQELLEPHIAIIKDILGRLREGRRVYLGITSGERKGSIAYIHSVSEYDRNHEPGIRHSGSWDAKVRITNDSLHCVIGWDKRRNKIQWSTHSHTVYLPDYEGPTVWKKFDKKAAAKQAMEEHEVKDREGNVLAVGDRVVYINARYGSGARLDRGEITNIKMNVDVQGENHYITVHVIIDNDEGEQSDIRAPDLSILKTVGPMELMSNQVLDF